MTYEGRVAEAIYHEPLIDPNGGAHRPVWWRRELCHRLARAAIAAMGPQLTAGEAKTLAEFLQEKHPRVLFGTAAETYVAKLSLIAREGAP